MKYLESTIKNILILLAATFFALNAGIFGIKFYYFLVPQINNLMISELLKAALSVMSAAFICVFSLLATVKLVFWGLGDYFEQ
jgi:hypothetical protein